MAIFEKKNERYKIYSILGFFLAIALISNPQKNFPIAQEDVQNYSAGREALKMKEYEKAITFFQKALTENPNYTDALTGMGIANDEIAKEYQKTAGQYYTKALIVDPRHAEALEYKGEFFLRMGKLKQAFDNYQTLLKVDPNEAEELKGSIDYFLKGAQQVLANYQPGEKSL